jgi:hypothetical protein
MFAALWSLRFELNENRFVEVPDILLKRRLQAYKNV